MSLQLGYDVLARLLLHIVHAVGITPALGCVFPLRYTHPNTGGSMDRIHHSVQHGKRLSLRTAVMTLLALALVPSPSLAVQVESGVSSVTGLEVAQQDIVPPRQPAEAIARAGSADRLVFPQADPVVSFRSAQPHGILWVQTCSRIRFA